MAEKWDLVEQTKYQFNRIKQELGIQTTFEELDSAFSIQDAVLNTGFVSDRFSRQLSAIIVDKLMSWNNYLHSLLMPNPQSMINMHESKAFNKEERKNIINLITKSMGIVSQNTLNTLAKNKSNEALFIDNSYKFWTDEFRPELEKIMKKIHENWDNHKDTPIGIN